MSCYLECDPATKLRNAQLVRTHRSISDPDYSRQDYDYADLAIRTGGSQNTDAATCGQLWVTYEIVLHAARVPDPNTDNIIQYIDPVWHQPLEDLQALLNVKGPQTDLEIIDRNEAIAIIRAQFAGIPYRLAYAQAEAAMRRAQLNYTPPDGQDSLPEVLKRLEEGKDAADSGPVATAIMQGKVLLSKESLVDPAAMSGWQTIRNRHTAQSPAPSVSG